MRYKISVALLLTILFTSGCATKIFPSQPVSQSPAQSQSEINANSETGTACASIINTGYKLSDTQEFIYSDNFPDKKIFPSAELAGIFKDSYSGRVLPVNPINNDEIFISTNKGLEQDERGRSTKMVNIIYSYNIKTSKLNNIYQEYTKEEKLNIVATDGVKLVTYHLFIGASPAPCWSPWLESPVNGENVDLQYLDIDHPEAGLKPYAKAQCEIDKEKQKQTECRASLGIN